MEKHLELKKQYNSIKNKYKDAIVLIKEGDQYHTFNEDAEKVAGLYSNNRVSNSRLSFDANMIDEKLRRLIKEGYRVAVCDAIEIDPNHERDVQREYDEAREEQQLNDHFEKEPD